MSNSIDTFSFNVVEIAIDGLRPHELQEKTFGDVSGAELDALAADIAEHGQREPIVVLPDGTIISGHQRVRAMSRLNRKTVRAIVRHDLVGKTDEITVLFVNDNLNRRHLGPLALARCYLTLREAMTSKRETSGIRKIESIKAAMLQRLAAVGCHIGGRSLSRYLNLLQLPRAIQDAVTTKRLTMQNAATIHDWSPRDRETIAAACAAGKSKQELAAILKQMRAKPQPVANRGFVESVCLLAAIGKSDSRLQEVVERYQRDKRTAKALKDARTAIDLLLNEFNGCNVVET